MPVRHELAHDTFARETAKKAHSRISQTENELRKKIVNLERIIARRAGFVARCSLCGDPCRPNRRYCHAHAWAEGADD